MKLFTILYSVALLVSTVQADILDEIAAADRKADAVVVAIATPEGLTAKQDVWRKAWIEGLGGLPERTPLNAKEGPVVKCDGFTLQNVLFESLPGVYVVGHLALPDSPDFKPPYPAVLMANGHSDDAIRAPRYAAHLAMMARAGFAAFSWDPVSQGERRQAQPKFDYTDNCSTEHTQIGFRGWLVGWNFARFLVWDGMRALDWLETRTDVDCSKVGVCGTSGGGTQSAYLQALDPRIMVAFPNCYVSSIRAVFRERGCHDAEQFFWNQLNVGVNHAAMLAMGCPRVAPATGSRWKDYFPHSGAVSTFAVYTNLMVRLSSFPTIQQSNNQTINPFHFHCDGPHGLPLPTRQAQVDWMSCCIKGGPMPRPLPDYWALSAGDHSGTNDPTTSAALPFPTNASFFTDTRHVRDLKGFKSLFALVAERADELARTRRPKTREQLREIVRLRAGIRPLSELCGAQGLRALPSLEPFDHPFGFWYLQGAYGKRRENEAAMLATLGRSVVGRDAERIIIESAKSGDPIVLRASGWGCIAAAHAYAAEPQLFSSVEFDNLPPSWTEMVTNPDPKDDSFAIGVWGALEEYDWTDLIPRKGET